MRELKHCIEKAVILSTSNKLSSEDFFFNPTLEPIVSKKVINLNELEKEALKKAIIIHNKNLSKVAKEIGISRTTLYKKIKKHGL